MSYSGAVTQAVPKNNSVSNALSDFDPCIERAGKFAAHLHALCDRVIGPRPTEVKQGGQLQGEAPVALIGSIHERRNRLSAILDDIDRSIESLDANL